MSKSSLSKIYREYDVVFEFNVKNGFPCLVAANIDKADKSVGLMKSYISEFDLFTLNGCKIPFQVSSNDRDRCEVAVFEHLEAECESHLMDKAEYEKSKFYD